MVDFDATFFAQIINFIILLGILGKFAFKPLMNVLDERANRISNDLDSAEKTRVEAEELKAQYTKQMEEARNEAAAIVAKATQIFARALTDRPNLVTRGDVVHHELDCLFRHQLVRKRAADIDIEFCVICKDNRHVALFPQNARHHR